MLSLLRWSACCCKLLCHFVHLLSQFPRSTCLEIFLASYYSDSVEWYFHDSTEGKFHLPINHNPKSLEKRIYFTIYKNYKNFFLEKIKNSVKIQTAIWLENICNLQIYFPIWLVPLSFCWCFLQLCGAFYFDEVRFVYSFLYVPCSRGHIIENIAAWNIWDFPTCVLWCCNLYL